MGGNVVASPSPPTRGVITSGCAAEDIDLESYSWTITRTRMTVRTLFCEEHQRLRAALRGFIESELIPNCPPIRNGGLVDREAWRKAGANGLLCATLVRPHDDKQIDATSGIVMLEEFGRANRPEFLGAALHSVRAARLIAYYGNDSLKRSYLPQIASGKLIGAVAESETYNAVARADLQVTAVRAAGHHVVSGVKRHVANGHQADLVVVPVTTDPSRNADSSSLLVVDTSMPGFSKGPVIRDDNSRWCGPADLHFDEVAVPVENLLGEESAGYGYLAQERPWYWMDAPVSAVAWMEAVLESVSPCACQRCLLCETRTEVDVVRASIDRCIAHLLSGTLSSEDALMARQRISHLAGSVLGTCHAFERDGGHWLSLLLAESPSLASASHPSMAERKR